MRKHHQVRKGQIVRVIDGPLTGFRGEVKKADEHIAIVAVQVFGREGALLSLMSPSIGKARTNDNGVH